MFVYLRCEGFVCAREADRGGSELVEMAQEGTRRRWEGVGEGG